MLSPRSSIIGGVIPDLTDWTMTDVLLHHISKDIADRSKVERYFRSSIFADVEGESLQ